MKKYLFTSESVTEGHPDKVCDKISDSILDAYLQKDSESRVAAETCIKNNKVVIMGEITSNAQIDIKSVVKEALEEIGYTDLAKNIDLEIYVEKQSKDISLGVDKKEQGAGDQGMMFGYACNETDTLMPAPIYFAHKLSKKLSDVRKKKEIDYLKPDGKTQVTIEYRDGKPKRIDTIVISNQHSEEINTDQITDDIQKYVIEPICKNLIDTKTNIFINPTGRFVDGGPYADSGLTGRKIIVDTYGGYSRHGGGAFSGKDPSKVDRSGAYMARYIAKNIVASKIAEKCEVQISYAIGIAEPVSIFVDTFDTSQISNEEIVDIIKKVFPLKPGDIIRHLDLKKPIYKKTAAYGHFGREEFNWEKTDKIDELLKLI